MKNTFHSWSTNYRGENIYIYIYPFSVSIVKDKIKREMTTNMITNTIGKKARGSGLVN